MLQCSDTVYCNRSLLVRNEINVSGQVNVSKAHLFLFTLLLFLVYQYQVNDFIATQQELRFVEVGGKCLCHVLDFQVVDIDAEGIC